MTALVPDLERIVEPNTSDKNAALVNLVSNITRSVGLVQGNTSRRLSEPPEGDVNMSKGRRTSPRLR